MEIKDIISIISLVLLYLTGLIGFWINVKIKLNELEIKMKELKLHIDENENTIKSNKKWGEDTLESERKTRKEIIDNIKLEMNDMKKDNLDSHKEILLKMDLFLTNFADFRVYVEQQFNKK